MLDNLNLVFLLFRESFKKNRFHRVAEPALIMEEAKSIEAYDIGGKFNGPLWGLYLFQLLQINPIIKQGDTVLDLGCGPGNLLCVLAKLNPGINFIGADASSSMLERARASAENLKLKNISFLQTDIKQLDEIQNNTIDAIISTLTLHHLSDEQDLEKSFIAIKRVLRPGGGIYISDLGAQKSEKIIKYYISRLAEFSSGPIVTDFRNSLYAAFSIKSVSNLTIKYFKEAKVYSTAFSNFLYIIKTADRRTLDENIIRELSNMKKGLSKRNLQDFSQISLLFKINGASIKTI